MANTTIPVELSSTPGIVDNSNATAITIDSSENVGIGTSSPSTPLHISKSVDGNATELLIENQFVSASSTDESCRIQSRFGGYDASYIITGKEEDWTTASNRSSYMSFTTRKDNTLAERMRIDSSGNVGIGVAAPTFPLDIQSNASASAIKIRGRSDDIAEVDFYNNANTSVMARFQVDTGYIATHCGGSERMRIDSLGKVGIGQTPGTPRLGVTASGTGYAAYLTFQTGGSGMGINCTGGGTQVFHYYFSNGTYVGQVYTTGSTTVWASASDYRLKENVVTDWDATTRLKQLKPSRFNFIKDADTTMDGFLAHEVQDIVPEAVIGEKDGLKADGTPKYQGIDQSKLVPLLVKTIQELEARITTLENA